MRRKSLWLSIALIVVLSFVQLSDTRKSSGSQKSVKVQLNSKWRQTPIYLEVAEFLSEENPNYFWSFLDKIGSIVDDSKENLDWNLSKTQKDQHDKSLEIADGFLRSEQKKNILKFSLSLRSYSPTVAIFRKFADGLIENREELKSCDWFVELSRPKNVDSFKQFNCQLDDVKASIASLVEHLKTSQELDNPLIYSVDHVYPSSKIHPALPTLILYGNVAHKQFHELHRLLREETAKHNIKYIVRYIYPVTPDMPKIALSGYGVELAIKSTEYKAQDDTKVRGEKAANQVAEAEKPDEVSGFIFSKLKQLNSALNEKLDNFQNYLLDSDKEIATLKAWELQEISLQAVTKVLSVPNDNALKELREISQNFPTVARSLVKIAVEPELKKEIVKNQHTFLHSLSLGTSDTALFINGLYYDVDGADVFSLFDTIKQEFSVVNKLHGFLDGDLERIKKFIKLDVNMDKQDYQIDIRDGSVNYINDIETDKMYRNWPSGLMDMLRPTYPGALRSVRRNMFHLVLVVDPSKRDAFEVLKLTESFYIHKAPVRIGLVFAVDRNMTHTGMTNGGVACLEAFNYISQQKSPYEGLSFLTDVIAYANSQNTGDLQAEDVIASFKSKMSGHSVDDVFGPDSAYDTGRQLAWEFIERTGLGSKLPKVLLNGVLIKDNLLNGDAFEEALLMEIMRQTTPIQKAIYKSELQEDDDILDWLMNKDTVMPRLNRVILGMDKTKDGVKDRFLDFTGTTIKLEGTNFAEANINDLQSTMADEMKYITFSKKEITSPVSLWIAADFGRSQAWNMLTKGLKHLKQVSKHMRISLVFPEWSPVNRAFDAAVHTIACQSKLEQFFNQYLEYLRNNPDYSEHSAKELLEIVQNYVPDELRSAFAARFEATGCAKNPNRSLHESFASRILQMSSKDIVVVMNGKILPVPENEEFCEDDFSLLEKFIVNLVGDKVLDSLNEKEKANPKRCSDLVLKLSTALFAKTNTKTRYEINNVRDDHSVLVLEPKNENEPAIELAVILDPLSRGAQKITPIVEVFHQVFNSRVKVYFNAVEKHSDMPVKTFYRSVLSSELEFETSGKVQDSVALFQQMPKTPLLTLGMQVPDNWMVEAVDAVYDLDNIHLEAVHENQVVANFELEHLLIEGHCFEQSSGSPPRGLQFTLGTETNPTRYDTIVMANLGYFQLKANPGIWLLRLRGGRSEEIYDIFSHEGTDKIVKSNEVIPVVSSFKSLVVKIRVNKKADKQNEELLYDSDETPDNGWFSWNGGSSNEGTKKIKEDEDSKRINIFSLATGHLYERLMRIMMTSVLRNTETPVKFWILKNYLSPQFKNVLPFMAAKYKFEYELVQYKWPRWLHQQTEKQRIIWGYKILFLDVLFPLDVKKIIFVDADQVVRADLKELRDLDLEGAPYGYTPFCESRKEMDGYRFWKQGYWATHLHNRRYHISALYVVDLQKFRRIAAGDRLRGQYQGLSQDPNSLSNLDQDLPNNMIHQVAIKSLPQEWLWCETWCDDASKKKAKTIDLCNNPKTKEPKLTGARRIIKEWETYDNELSAMYKEFQNIEDNNNIAGAEDETIGNKHTEL